MVTVSGDTSADYRRLPARRPTAPVRFRDRIRRQLREDVVDHVRELVVERGWQAVHMGDVAATVGVSRQTLYTEFGSKDALAEAVAMREARTFLENIDTELMRHRGRLGEAIAAAVTRTLRAGEENPLLRTVLTSAHPGNESLLPVLTSRGEPIFRVACAVLTAHVRENYPELDPQEIAEVIDSAVRVVISHLILPLDPIEIVARRVARQVVRAVGLSEQCTTHPE